MKNMAAANIHNLPLPPEEFRTVEQRIVAANAAWNDLFHSLSACSPAGGAIKLMLISRFVHDLIDSQQLRQNILNYFERQLRGEGKPEQLEFEGLEPS